MSERRACRVVGVDRTSVRYEGTRGDDTFLRGRLNELAAERRRFGYRRLHVLLKREGHARQPQARSAALLRGEADSAPPRRPQAGGGNPAADRDAGGSQRAMEPGLASSHQLTDGRRFRILAVVDDCTRECLALAADTSLSGLRVARELDDIVRRRGRPTIIVSVNGTEFTSNAILGWADETGVGWHYIAPGKPQQNVRAALEPMALQRSPSKASTAACGTNS